QDITELTNEQKSLIEQYRNRSENRDKEIALAFAIEAKLKGGNLTKKQQDIIKEFNAQDITKLTNKQKRLIEQNRNKKEKYNKKKEKDLKKKQQNINKKFNAQDITELTNEQKSLIEQNRNSHEKYNKNIVLALAIEAKLKGGNLTKKQQDVIKEFNAQ